MSVKLTSEGIRFPDGSVNESTKKGEVSFFNECLVKVKPRSTNAHIGGNGTWSVPEDVSTITFHAWGGGGAGAGTCCHSCLCTKDSYPGHGGWYARKTIRKCDGDFTDGDTYTWCYGMGGNGSDNSGCGCNTLCCDAPRGCASYVTGAGLSNFCAPGGRGGYGTWCDSNCCASWCRQDDANAVGMTVGGNVDFAMQSNGLINVKANDNYEHAGHVQTSPNSYGLENSQSVGVQCNVKRCGYVSERNGMNTIASGGLSVMKTQCNQYICANCAGSPGNPGMVKIEWS
jgi:hypothetical protein